MKKVLFGIAMILFAMFLHMVDLWGLLGLDWFIVLIGLGGLIIAGIGAFTRDK